MKTRFAALMIGLAVALPAGAATKEKAPGATSPLVPLRAELEPLRFLIGHCWRGEFSNKAVDTHCFETVYGGQHVRDRHEVIGPDAPYRGETLYSWDGSVKRVGYTYWNSVGGVSRGTVAGNAGGLDFGSETYTGADGHKMTVSTIWRKIGGDAYEAVSRTGEGPMEGRVVRYVRAD
jgi:hypothetical protein